MPYQAFKDAGFNISFATEAGKAPECDSKMLTGVTQMLLGAAKPAIDAYNHMIEDAAWKSPRSWKDPSFSLDEFDLVFLPGGHDKGVRQILDSPIVQKKIVAYFPQTRKPSKKAVAAICHGVQLLAHSTGEDGKSVLHDVKTTALPGQFEGLAYNGTRLFLGDYYKTYGAGTDNVEDIVRKKLDDDAQWQVDTSMSKPFVVEEEKYNYLSGRWPGDAQLLAEKTVAMVKEVTSKA